MVTQFPHSRDATGRKASLYSRQQQTGASTIGLAPTNSFAIAFVLVFQLGMPTVTHWRGGE
jgi:hypothetical protein